jgi:transcriptional regulator with XRE-family HTH domain
VVNEPALPADSDEAWRALGERLRRSREYLGLSQADVASALKLPRPSVTQIEAGRRKVSILELQQLARIYGQSLDYFIGKAPEIPEDATTTALFRTTRALTDGDRQQVLRFAQFLRNAGPAPAVEPDQP